MVQTIINEFNLSISFANAFNKWWYVPLDNNVLRLTKSGFDVFLSVDEPVEFELKNKSNSTIISLTKLTGPWYIVNHTVYLFGKFDIVNIKLFNNIHKYLSTL